MFDHGEATQPTIMSAAFTEAKQAYADGHYEQTLTAAALANAENLERLTYMAEAITNALIHISAVAGRVLRGIG
jgi:hypothetical protein